MNWYCRIIAIQLVLLSTWGVSAPRARAPVTEAQIAERYGLSLEQIRRLHRERAVSIQDIPKMPPAKLKRALWRLDNPKPDHPGEAAEFRLLQLRDENGRIPHNALLKAWREKREMPSDAGTWDRLLRRSILPGAGAATAQDPLQGGAVTPKTAGIESSAWTWIGPGNIGGRVRAVLIHPGAPDTMWAGSVGGGIWKTTNGGTSWFVLDDFMSNLAVASMVIDPTDSDTLYAGTGEGFYNSDAIRGAGVFKTVNGGTTWSQLVATASSSYYYVNRLAIHPTNGAILLAATRSGIYRTINGGTSWTLQRAGNVLDLDFDPADGSKCIAGGHNGLALYSINGGVSWSTASGLPSPGGFVNGRVEVAYAPSAPATVFVSIDNNSGQVYRSTDGGQTYSLRNTGNNYLGGQGWYDNIVWVDPTDPDVVIVGGIDLWRSTNGGTSLTKISQWFSAPASAHADHHAIMAHPDFDGVDNKTVFFGNDGGVYKANDVYTVATVTGWTELNNNLGITQFYGGAGNSNTLVIIGGTQDNGTLRYTSAGGSESWTSMFGGDGGWCAADQTDPNYFYGEYVYVQIHRSVNAGVSASYIYSGISDAGSGSTANFIAPFILDPNNQSTMLAGGNSLWRSTNVKAGTPSWSNIKASISDHISAIAVAPGDADIIWVGHNNGNVYFTTNGTAASPVWTRVDAGTPALPNRFCTRLTIDPNNHSRVFATFGGYSSDNVWRTTNSGTSWVDISGPLPSAPIRTLVISRTDGNHLYIGTEVGIFASEDGGTSWSPGNEGPANVSVDELFWMGEYLVAATHGRGFFKASLSTFEMRISPSTSLSATGWEGGPFSPDCGTYVVTNSSSSNLNWSVAVSEAWLTLTTTGGVLTGGASTSVTACINAVADTLAGGVYTDTIAFSNITSGVAQNRSAVLTIAAVATLPLSEGFEGGSLSNIWVVTGTEEYRTQVTTEQAPHGGSYHLLMDDSVAGEAYSRNEATFCVNLACYSNVTLSFWAREFSDEPDGPPAIPFLDGADFDGVAVSEDGTNWYEIIGLRSLNAAYAQQVVDVDAAIAPYGLSYGPAFLFRFNQYDNFPITSDGIAIDDISITGILVSTTTLTTTTSDSSSTSTTSTTTVTTTSSSTTTASVLLAVASPYGTAVPPVGPNVYSPGTLLTASIVDSPVTVIDIQSMMMLTCTGWVGTGSVPAFGPGTNTGPFTLTVNSTVTWLWDLTDLVLSNQTETGTAMYEASGTIRAGNGYLVIPPGNVTLEAGQEVRLTDGFTATTGSTFRAVIDP